MIGLIPPVRFSVDFLIFPLVFIDFSLVSSLVFIDFSLVFIGLSLVFRLFFLDFPAKTREFVGRRNDRARPLQVPPAEYTGDRSAGRWDNNPFIDAACDFQPV